MAPSTSVTSVGHFEIGDEVEVEVDVDVPVHLGNEGGEPSNKIRGIIQRIYYGKGQCWPVLALNVVDELGQERQVPPSKVSKVDRGPQTAARSDPKTEFHVIRIGV